MALKPRLAPELPLPILPSSLQAFFPPAADAMGKLGPREYEFFHGVTDVAFRPDTASYCPIGAWVMAECAFLAYSNHCTVLDVENAIRPALARLFRSDFELRVFIGRAHCWTERVPDDRIQCYVAHNGHWGVMAFRGTLPDSLPNWLTDADFILEPDAGGASARVHRGFKAALNCLWRPGADGGLERYLQATLRNHPSLSLWCTGHSLGAAMAILAVHRLPRVQTLYTYGSPKVGNAAFGAEMRQLGIPHHRIVNHRDVVSTLPFFEPFEHCGTLKYLQTPSGFWETLREFAAALRFGKAANPLQRHFDALGKLREEFQENVGILRASLDHSPIFYSKHLWNELVRSVA